MIIPPGYAQVNLRFTGSGLPSGAQVAYGVQQTSGMLPSDVGAIVLDIWNDELMKNILGSEATLSDILVKFGPASTGPSHLTSANIVGAWSSGVGNPSTSLLVRKNALSSGGRRHRGRMFWPAIPEAYVLPGGGVDATAMAAAQTKFNTYFNRHFTDGIKMVLLHSHADDNPTVLDSLTVQARVANQRRRNRR